MSEISVKKSMVIIKKEKLVIILKELLHLKYILNYYSPKKNSNEIRKIDMSIANNSLQAVEESLKKIKSHIKMLEKSLVQKNNNIYFFLLYSKIRDDFNNILYIIELIYKKVYQIFEESYHQYIPKPTLGRRFSSNNLVNHLKQHYEGIIKELISQTNYKRLILSWSYRNYISLEEKHDQFTRDNGSRYGSYINIPYWYYEIPTLLPSITHECARVALLQKDSKLKNLKKALTDKINEYLNNPRYDLSFSEEEKILQERYSLTDKVVADIATYSIYKNAYLFSLFHDIAGVGFSKLFNLKNGNIQEQDSIKEYIINNFDTKIESYKFDPLRDLSIIRLTILLDYAKKDTSNPKDMKTIEQMQKMFSSILSYDGLEKIYNNHNHYAESFLHFKKALINVAQLYIDKIDKLSKPLLDIKKLPNNIDFNELWNQHFKQNYHKNELRKLIYKNTVEIACKNNLNSEELYTPFSLTFIKILKVIDRNKPHQDLDSKINSHFQDKNYYHAFGIYDLAILDDTSNDFIKMDEIIDDKFNTIKDLNQQKKMRYYESKFSLMQIYPTIEGTIDTQSNIISVLYNIELNYTNNDLRENLANAITKIAKVIKDKKNKFYQAKIFQTLGPGDLILLIENVPQDDFLFLTELILPLQCVKRTFTIPLTHKNNKKESIEPNPYYRTVSFIRFNLNEPQSIQNKIEDFFDVRDIQNCIESIHITSGVLDIEIVWKAKTPFETIMEFYNYLMKKDYVRDFQTKFNKIYPLNSIEG